MNTKLLELRKEIKKKMPSFVRQGYNKKRRLGKKWRRARGRHSKMRVGFRGKANVVNPGYGSPKAVRGLDLNGFKGIVVNNVNDLNKVKDNIIIGKNVGQKKRLELIKTALEKKIKILNLMNPEAYLKQVTELLRKKKEEKKAEKKEVTPKEVKKVEVKEEISDEERKKKNIELKKKVLEGK
ncbi:50S ribosomal protein L32e [Candidatus Woesearchaeota archaeon]|nr:50S ribosomal protein L32e [Candidatus Woesearchaeota archaeon]